MSDKESTIAEIEAAYRELTSAIEGIPTERMTDVFYDRWSAKDLVAHTASLDEFTINDLQRIVRGHLPCFAAFKESEVDEWNAFFMRPRRLFPLAQVMFESAHWHAAVVDVLRGLPDSMFGPGVVGNICAVIYGHLREHAGNIRAWRQREGI